VAYLRMRQVLHLEHYLFGYAIRQH
jgi:hypothetical protein